MPSQQAGLLPYSPLWNGEGGEIPTRPCHHLDLRMRRHLMIQKRTVSTLNASVRMRRLRD